ncbi:MAG: nitroreductase/quinone reductase family protein [Gammaproteobacteria bacterium]
MAALACRQYAWQRWLQHVPASRPGAWFFARSLHHVDRLLMHLSGGRLNVATSVTGLPTLVLVSRGARSGRLRETPLIGIPDGERIVLIASNWGQAHSPAWYYNLRADPTCAARFDGFAGAYVAREVTDPAEYARCWQAACDIYLGYPKYRERVSDRHIPVMLLEPLAAAA